MNGLLLKKVGKTVYTRFSLGSITLNHVIQCESNEVCPNCLLPIISLLDRKY